MSFTRRTFLLGLGTGVSVLALAACTPERPVPTKSPTPTPTGDLPVPSSVRRSAWTTDPFSLGARSHLPVGATPQHRLDLAEPVLDRVFFSGEALSEESPGTIAGARSMGTRIAVRAAEAASPGERIAIVGAGIAGAEAARYLNSLGMDVVVLEARDRTGGRIQSVTEDDRTTELGPWSLRETADADIIAALDRLDIGVVPVGATTLARGVDAPGDGAAGAGLFELPENAVGATAVATAVTWASEQQADTALADALSESGASNTAADQNVGDVPGETVLAAALADLVTATGAGLDVLSSWFTPAPDPAAPADPLVVADGPLVTLVDSALEGIETFLSTAVVGISYDDDGVSLRLGTGESLSVDRVIVTVPLGVLQGDGIRFSPLLPFSHRTAISALGAGAVETVWLEFDEPFWSTEAQIWTLAAVDAPITTWVNLQPSLGRPVLVGVVGGPKAVDLPEGDELTRAVLESLAPFVDEAD